MTFAPGRPQFDSYSFSTRFQFVPSTHCRFRLYSEKQWGVLGSYKVTETAAKLLKCLASVNLCAGRARDLPSRQIQASLAGFDRRIWPQLYWVR